MGGRWLWGGPAALAAGIVLVSSAGALADQTVPVARIVPSVCRDFDGYAAKDHRRCFQVDVPEDPSHPAGRHIQLDGFVVAATAPNPTKAALFVLDGGPGNRATDDMAGESDWSEVLTDHDVVVIDQRGVGTTPDIRCNGPVDDAHLPEQLAHSWPVARLKDCLAAIAGHADVRLYTTANSAEDIELVRRALGYDRIDLLAGSWGTRLAQVYAHLHGDKVRTMTLSSVDAPDTYVPADRASEAETVFTAILDRCRADPACAQAFPDLRSDFEAAKRHLWNDHFETKDAAGRPVPISPNVLASALRYEAYGDNTAVRLPLQIHALAHGDVRDLTKYAVRWREKMETGPSIGLYMSITCTEGVAHDDLEALRRQARGTLVEAAQIDDLAAACAFWPKGVDRKEMHELSTWDGPVLMLSGALDPATPPAWADRLIGYFPHGRLIRLPYEGHVFTDPALDCLQPVIVAFIKSGSAFDLDTSCTKALHYPKFVTSEGQSTNR